MANTRRDDFNQAIIRLLRERAGNTCSNPDCEVVTAGPNGASDKTTNIGVAAHITAAAPNGPRYNVRHFEALLA